MHMVWLDSKTTIPSVTMGMIDRGRLKGLLGKNGRTRITFVRAPAGYGKTTMLSQWIGQFDERVAWLSIDDTDNDPIRFWKYVIRTVSDALTYGSGSRLLSLFNGQSPFELLVDSFLNELGAIRETIHIVIDDYHLIDNPVIHDMMARFIDYLPNNTSVYLASRTDLPLPFAKWRVRGWLTEIGMNQLRFTYEEVEHFYTKRRLYYEDAESLQHVLDMTEGWPAGIQLAGLSGSMSTTGEWNVNLFDSAQPFITEFLLKEILASLSPSTQDFLVRTSILNQLEPEICDVLTNRMDSYNVLLELEKKGLFIVRLHSNQPIFRYHHLFANALQIELRHRFSKETISTFYKEVAILLREHGNFISAIEFVLEGQLYKVADEWITAHLIEVFTLGQTSTFIRWVKVLRNNGYSVNIETLVMYIISLVNIYEIEEATHLIAELDRRHEIDQWMDTDDYKGMASILDTERAYVLLACGKDIVQSMDIIVRQKKRGRASSRWDAVPMQYNWFEPTLLRTSIGRRGRLLWIDEVLPLLELFQEADMQEKNLTGFVFGVAAEISYNRNSMDQALTELEVALQYGNHFKDPSLFIPMYILKAKVFAAKKLFVEAYAILDYAMETTNERHWMDSVRAMKAHCYLLEGHPLQAELELSESTGLNNSNAKSGQEFWLLVHVRLLLATGQAGDALKTSLRIKEKALQEMQISTIVEAAILEAICQMDLGNKEAALGALHKALELGEPYGYVRLYLNEEVVILLLKKYLKKRQNSKNIHWGSVSLSYVEQLILEGANGHNSLQDTTNEMLTPREQDVLKLLVSGVSNREIASRLTLTEGTVRVYLTEIYSKLGVKSRTQAVLLAKESDD